MCISASGLRGLPPELAHLLDRLLHRATVVGIDGPSHRLRHHQRHAETIRAAAASRTA